jgi:hypothetical protein
MRLAEQQKRKIREFADLSTELSAVSFGLSELRSEKVDRLRMEKFELVKRQAYLDQVKQRLDMHFTMDKTLKAEYLAEAQAPVDAQLSLIESLQESIAGIEKRQLENNAKAGLAAALVEKLLLAAGERHEGLDFQNTEMGDVAGIRGPGSRGDHVPTAAKPTVRGQP